MNTAPAPTRAQRSATADFVTVILFAIAAGIGTIITTTLRLFDTFRPDGFAWRLHIDELPVDTSFGAALTDSVLVVSPDVNAVSMASGAVSGIIAGLAALTVTAAVAFVAWRFLRGGFFVTATARAFDVIGWTLLIGGVGVMSFDTLARNGVLAAVGIEGEPIHPTEFAAFAPVWAIAVAVGLLGHAFRRGIRLQKETEGLV